MRVGSMRESNMELLRIVAMIGIIIDHIFNFGVKPQIIDITRYGTGNLFNNFQFYKRLTAVDICISFGIIGNMLFILLTGYYLINKKKININKQIMKIISQLLYVTLFIVVLSLVYYKLIDNHFASLVPICFLNDGWWYAGYYLIIIIIAYLYLNKFLNKLNKKNYLTFLMILFVLITTVFTRTLLSELSENLSITIVGIFLYSLGGYISKYNPLKQIKTSALVVTMFIIFLLMGLSYYNNAISNINFSLLNNSIEFTQTFYTYTNNSFWILMISLCIFEIFTRIKIKESKIINYIASAMFMTYMLHVNDFAKALFKNIEWVQPYYDNFLLFIGIILLTIIVIIALGIICYTMYVVLYKICKSDKFKKIILKQDNISRS